MNTLQENLKQDIKELVEKYQNQEITLSDININIPEALSTTLAVFETPDFSISNSITSQRKYPVIVNGIKSYYTETQASKLRQKNDANMILDMPQLTLAVNIPGFNKELDFENLPYPSQKIILCGMESPGKFLNQDDFWSHDTFKRYIFMTRRLLEDNKVQHIIKTSKNRTSLPGSYYFNPRLECIVIKNPKST